MSFLIGDITELDLLNVFPFSGKIVIKELSGYEIKQALEHGVAGKISKTIVLCCNRQI